MKKFIATLLASALMITLTVGCGETPKPGAKDTIKETSKETAKETIKETVKEKKDK